MEERTKPYINRENSDMYPNDVPMFRCRKAFSSGFTLVELLAVTVIIAILASLTTLAMNSSVQAAKEAKTRGTILKLDTALQQIYESYEDKFENIFSSNHEANLRNQVGGGVPNDEFQRIVGKAKLHFIRDLMRMEMPIDWNEVNFNDATTTDGPISIAPTTNTYSIWVEKPRVLDFYRDAYTNTGAANINTRLASAELLFLVVMNLNPEALESFHESEIGDIDGNGLFEFHDAWGNPIQYLRWAPAFAGSDKQPDVITRSGFPLNTDLPDNAGDSDNVTTWKNNDPASVDNDEWDDPSTISDTTVRALVSAMQQAASKHHDPFDTEWQTRSWFLYPVVFSAGADQKNDIYMVSPTYSASMTAWTSTSQPMIDPFETPLGIPQNKDDDGVLNHYDNIHNHRISGGF